MVLIFDVRNPQLTSGRASGGKAGQRHGGLLPRVRLSPTVPARPQPQCRPRVSLNNDGPVTTALRHGNERVGVRRAAKARQDARGAGGRRVQARGRNRLCDNPRVGSCPRREASGPVLHWGNRTSFRAPNVGIIAATSRLGPLGGVARHRIDLGNVDCLRPANGGGRNLQNIHFTTPDMTPQEII